MPVLDMPDTVMDLAMLLLTDTDTTARDPLMPSQRLRPMLDFSMEDTDMVLDSDTPVLDAGYGYGLGYSGLGYGY